LWKTPAGSAERAERFAQAIDNLVMVAGSTHAKRFAAIVYNIRLAAYEALHGETESFDYTPADKGS
jgi:hypothetical protein